MTTKYDDDATIKISKQWFLEVGFELFKQDADDPKAVYYAHKIEKMYNREQYSKKLLSLNDE